MIAFSLKTEQHADEKGFLDCSSVCFVGPLTTLFCGTHLQSGFQIPRPSRGMLSGSK